MAPLVDEIRRICPDTAPLLRLVLDEIRSIRPSEVNLAPVLSEIQRGRLAEVDHELLLAEIRKCRPPEVTALAHPQNLDVAPVLKEIQQTLAKLHLEFTSVTAKALQENRAPPKLDVALDLSRLDSHLAPMMETFICRVRRDSKTDVDIMREVIHKATTQGIEEAYRKAGDVAELLSAVRLSGTQADKAAAATLQAIRESRSQGDVITKEALQEIREIRRRSEADAKEALSAIRGSRGDVLAAISGIRSLFPAQDGWATKMLAQLEDISQLKVRVGLHHAEAMSELRRLLDACATVLVPAPPAPASPQAPTPVRPAPAPAPAPVPTCGPPIREGKLLRCGATGAA